MVVHNKTSFFLVHWRAPNWCDYHTLISQYIKTADSWCEQQWSSYYNAKFCCKILGPSIQVEHHLTHTPDPDIVLDQLGLIGSPSSTDANQVKHLREVMEHVRSMEAPPDNIQDPKDQLQTSWYQIPQDTPLMTMPWQLRAVLAAKGELA